MTKTNAVEKIIYKGYEIEIIQDDNGINPRKDFDPLGTMICFHNQYSLGDKHDWRNPKEMYRQLAIESDPYLQDRIEYWENGKGWALIINRVAKMSLESSKKWDTASGEVDRIIDKLIQSAIDKNYVVLPLYLYDHAGITMSTSPFSCPWDSGQVGIIYISKKKALEEYSWKRLTKSNRTKLISYLVAEVELYDQFLTGDCYGYNIHKLNEDDENDEDYEVDSCWGFFGHNWEENGLFDHAKPSIDHHILRMKKAEEHYRNCWSL